MGNSDGSIQKNSSFVEAFWDKAREFCDAALASQDSQESPAAAKESASQDTFSDSEAAASWLRPSQHLPRMARWFVEEPEFLLQEAFSLSADPDAVFQNLEEMEQGLSEIHSRTREEKLQAMGVVAELAQNFLNEPATVEAAAEAFGILHRFASDDVDPQIHNLAPQMEAYGLLAEGEIDEAKAILETVVENQVEGSGVQEAKGVLARMERDQLAAFNLAALEAWESFNEEGQQIVAEESHGVLGGIAEMINDIGNEDGKLHSERILLEWEDRKQIVAEIKGKLQAGEAASIREALEQISQNSDSPFAKEAEFWLSPAASYISETAVVGNLIQYAAKNPPDAKVAQALLQQTFLLEADSNAVQCPYAVYSLVHSFSDESSLQQETGEHMEALQGNASFGRAAKKFVFSLSPESVAVDVGIMFASAGAGTLAKMAYLRQAGQTGLKATVIGGGIGFGTEVTTLWALNTGRAALHQDPNQVFSSEHLLKSYGATLIMIGGIKSLSFVSRGLGVEAARRMGAVQAGGKELSLGGKALTGILGHGMGVSAMLFTTGLNQSLHLEERPTGGVWETVAHSLFGYLTFALGHGLANAAIRTGGRWMGSRPEAVQPKLPKAERNRALLRSAEKLFGLKISYGPDGKPIREGSDFRIFGRLVEAKRNHPAFSAKVLAKLMRTEPAEAARYLQKYTRELEINFRTMRLQEPDAALTRVYGGRATQEFKPQTGKDPVPLEDWTTVDLANQRTQVFQAKKAEKKLFSLTEARQSKRAKDIQKGAERLGLKIQYGADGKPIINEDFRILARLLHALSQNRGFSVKEMIEQIERGNFATADEMLFKHRVPVAVDAKTGKLSEVHLPSESELVPLAESSEISQVVREKTEKLGSEKYEIAAKRKPVFEAVDAAGRLVLDWKVEGEVSVARLKHTDVEFRVEDGELWVRGQKSLTINGEPIRGETWASLAEGDTLLIGDRHFARSGNELREVFPTSGDATPLADGGFGRILDNGDGTVSKVSKRVMISGAGAKRVGKDLLDAEQSALAYVRRLGIRDFVPDLKGRIRSDELVIGKVPGRTLDALAAAEVKEIPQEAWNAFRAKLIRMNAAGLEHGDLHPGNILWDGKVLRLIDFGSSRLGTRSNRDQSKLDSIEAMVAESGFEKFPVSIPSQGDIVEQKTEIPQSTFRPAKIREIEDLSKGIPPRPQKDFFFLPEHPALLRSLDGWDNLPAQISKKGVRLSHSNAEASRSWEIQILFTEGGNFYLKPAQGDVQVSVNGEMRPVSEKGVILKDGDLIRLGEREFVWQEPCRENRDFMISGHGLDPETTDRMFVSEFLTTHARVLGENTLEVFSSQPKYSKEIAQFRKGLRLLEKNWRDLDRMEGELADGSFSASEKLTQIREIDAKWKETLQIYQELKQSSYAKKMERYQGAVKDAKEEIEDVEYRIGKWVSDVYLASRERAEGAGDFDWKVVETPPEKLMKYVEDNYEYTPFGELIEVHVKVADAEMAQAMMRQLNKEKGVEIQEDLDIDGRAGTGKATLDYSRSEDAPSVFLKLRFEFTEAPQIVPASGW